MRLKIVSDVHLEYLEDNESPSVNYENEDIFIIAGDLSSFPHRFRAMRYIKNYISSGGNNVLYVLGNHEYYTSDIESVNKFWKAFSFPGVTVCDYTAKSIKIGQYMIISCTLWCDTKNLPDSMCLQINDFHKIRDFTKEKQSYMYNKGIESLESLLKEEHDKVIVVTHHAPDKKDVMHRSLNEFFYNNLEQFIKKYPKIKLWIHGHTHEFTEFKIGDTLIKSFLAGDVNNVDLD